LEQSEVTFCGSASQNEAEIAEKKAFIEEKLAEIHNLQIKFVVSQMLLEDYNERFDYDQIIQGFKYGYSVVKSILSIIRPNMYRIQQCELQLKSEVFKEKSEKSIVFDLR